MMDHLLKRCRIKSSLFRQCLAEFFGVYILILFGCGSVAQVTTSQNTKGEYLSINLGFALGTTFGIYVAKGVSGAHLNPAVSLTLCVLGRFSWTCLPFYVCSQLLGAFLAAATVALQYYDAIMDFTGGHLTVSGATATAGIFSTYPADYLSLWGGVVDQIIGTAALLVCVLALGDPRNTPAPPGLEPVLVGAAVLVIGISMGSNSGYAINPARDFGPRLFSYIAGWGDEVFRAGRGWWWIPVFVTCVGALLGALLYELLIGVHHPDSEPEDAEDLTAVLQQTVELDGMQTKFDAIKENGKDGIFSITSADIS
ncbi:aquaporin-10b [Carassius carassius]|uniref:aquaporin-10b n=1 Tax=Carassius carassius TaxID=217509 RepID=UPI00286895D0|nr:aquaporin-10b [Carassius carassius]